MALSRDEMLKLTGRMIDALNPIVADQECIDVAEVIVLCAVAVLRSAAPQGRGASVLHAGAMSLSFAAAQSANVEALASKAAGDDGAPATLN